MVVEGPVGAAEITAVEGMVVADTATESAFAASEVISVVVAAISASNAAHSSSSMADAGSE